MTKGEFVAKLTASAGITKKQAEQVFSVFVETIKDSLLKNERIALTGLGSFYSVERKARKGRNPRTGAEIKIPARKAVKFSAAGTVTRALNEAKKVQAKTAKKKK
jgi:DNA-binding protein HU-beta